MDNADFHKVKEMQEALLKAGHTLEYLPLYPPNLNNIEQKWAHAKLLRKRYNYEVNSLFRDYYAYGYILPPYSPYFKQY